jgi:hypothetical protein
MAGFFNFVDVAPDAPTAPVGDSGLFAKAMGVFGFVAVAALEGMAKQSADELSEDAGFFAPYQIPGADDVAHDDWAEFYGPMKS